MNNFKKYITFFIMLVLFLFSFSSITNVFAQESCDVSNTQNNALTIYLFWGDGCPHCAKEKVFLSSLKQKYPNISIRDFELWNNKDNGKLLQKISQKLNIEVKSIPITIIGNNVITGYSDDFTTGKQIEDKIKYCVENTCQDEIKSLLECCGDTNDPIVSSSGSKINTNTEEQKVNIPIFGEIELKNLSLPVLSIVVGTLDGFNPCAMWILLFLMSMLLGMKNRTRMWILGTAFIFSSAIAYFFFMVAWLNILMFFSFLIWVKYSIGVFAIGGGSYNIWQYFKEKDSGCSVVGEEKRSKMFDKIRNIVQEKSFVLALIGICILAFAVNVVELLCSAGLPVVFTNILTLNKLSNIEYYLYILLYIFFFMIDDLFVFVVSMITLEVTGITTKYTKYSHIIGGILMLIVGILLIFKPDLLMFG